MDRRWVRKLLIMEWMPQASVPAKVGHWAGSKVRGRLCMTSELSRCGSFWMIHVENSLRRVCRSVSCVLKELSEMTLVSCFWKNLLANVADPTGAEIEKS